MTLRLSTGGNAIRLVLSNELGKTPLRLADIHVALSVRGHVVPGSDRLVTFGGKTSLTIPAGAPAISDAVALAVPAFAQLVVSLYVPAEAPTLTVHQFAQATALVAPGDQAGAAKLQNALPTTMRYVLSGVDVATPAAHAATLVVLGDSMADGYNSSLDQDHRWPDDLARDLARCGITNIGIANAGISGNRLLSDGYGASALARFNRDVLAAPHVKYLIVSEGINDIGIALAEHQKAPSIDHIIEAYRQIIARAHARGIKVYGTTLTPIGGMGAAYHPAEVDALRQKVNTWIRQSGAFDAVLDFDRAVADPTATDSKAPARLAPRFDSGDHLHPSDAGNAALAASIPCDLFR